MNGCEGGAARGAGISRTASGHPNHAMVAFVVLLAGALASAQEPFEIKETFSFGSTLAVASDGTVPDADQIIIDAAGSGFYVLDGTAQQPVKLASVPDYKVRCRGLVRDIKLTADKVWVAAGIAGLKRFRRDTLDEDLQFKFGEVDPAAWSLDVMHIDAFDYVVVGTNENQIGGTIHLLRVNAQGVVQLLDTQPADAPVYSIALTTGLLANTLTALVGSSCADTEAQGCGSLKRYDVNHSAPTPVFGASTGSWPTVPCTDPTAVRDIVIRDSTKRAYVAAFRHGIHVFDLNQTGLQEEVGGGFPITNPTDGPNALYNGLAINEDEDLLVASVGDKLSSEYQYWGELNIPESCDDDGRTLAMQGLKVFRLADGAQVGSLGVSSAQAPSASKLQRPPLAVSVRPRDGSEFLIDVATGTRGLAVVRASLEGATWRLSRTGWWSAENAPPNEKAPGGSFDDVKVKADHMYVGTEGSLLTFEAPSSGAPLADFTALSNTGCILLNGVSSTAAATPMLYAYMQDNGVRFYNLTNPAHPVASTGFLPTEGRGYCCYLTVGMDNYRWLYVASERDDSTLAVNCDPPGTCDPCCDPSGENATSGGIRIYRVEDANGLVLEPDSSTELLGALAPSACCHSQAEQFRAFDVIVVDESATTQIVWASYHRGILTTDCGLLVLRATWNGTSVDIEEVSRLPFADPNSAGVCSRLTYDESRDILYAAYASHGFAMYNVSSAAAPFEMGRFQMGTTEHPWLLENTLSSLQVWPGPNNYVYVSLMNWGVGILDASNGATFAEGFKFGSPFEMTFIADGFYDAPADPGKPARSAVYIADGGGGVHRVQFNVF